MRFNMKENNKQVFNSTLYETNEEVKKHALEYSMFTWSPQKYIKTIAVKYAAGCYYWDYSGKKYFDLCSQLACVNIGHGNPKVQAAIKRQVETVSFVKPKFTTDVRGAAAEMIIREFAPANMRKVFFSLGGAESNEYAIRMAQTVTGRPKIFSQYNSYHGSTYGAANLTGEARRNSGFYPAPGYVHFFGPASKDCFGDFFRDEEEESDFYLKMLEEQLICENPTTVAAIFIEAINGGNGAIVSSKSYIKGVRRLCDKYGILMVIDEVLTGFGRTGKAFAIQHYDVEADMITFAKGVTSAYLPLGGVILNDKLSNYFDEVGIPIGCTYNSHPMSCAAALANMEVIIDENLITKCNQRGELLKQGLEQLVQKHPCLKERRGLALLQGLKMQNMFCNREALTKVFKLFAENGYPTNGNDGLILFAPPLIVTEKEIEAIIEMADYIFGEMDEYMYE